MGCENKQWEKTEESRRDWRGCKKEHSWRILWFWVKNTLEVMGLTIGAAVVLMVFFGIGKIGPEKGLELVQVLLGLFPWYLLIVGMFISFMLCMSYYQVYFPVLLSMNGTRKSIMKGICGSIAGMMFGILILAGIIWCLVPGDVSQSGRMLLPLIAGCYFVGNAFFLILGAVIVRWGKVGTFLLVVLLFLTGLLAGIFTAMFKDTNTAMTTGTAVASWLSSGNEFAGLLVVGAGLLLYGAAGILAFVLMKNREVRV